MTCGIGGGGGWQLSLIVWRLYDTLYNRKVNLSTPTDRHLVNTDTLSIQGVVLTIHLRHSDLRGSNLCDITDSTLWHRSFSSINLTSKHVSGKELSLCHKFTFCKTYIFSTLWCKPLIFQTYIIYSLKYERSTSLGCKDIEIRKSEFAAKSQFLYLIKY